MLVISFFFSFSSLYYKMFVDLYNIIGLKSRIHWAHLVYKPVPNQSQNTLKIRDCLIPEVA